MTLKFRSGVFHFTGSSLRCSILPTGVNLGKIQLIGLDLERHTHLSIQSITAEMDVREKTKTWESKKCLQSWGDRIVLRQIWEDYKKEFCCVECSQEHLASIILNGWSLKQSGLFLDLASWPNWAIEGAGSWLERWSRHWWSLWLSSMILYGDGTNLQKDITATLHQSGLDGKVTKLKLLLSKDTRNHDWNLLKYTQISLSMKKKDSLVWWTSIPYSCLR